MALAAGSAPAHAETVLRRANGEEPNSLDPHRTIGVNEVNIVQDLFDGLTTFDPAGRVVLSGAEKIESSADGLVHVVTLRRDARWSNGEPVTAEDYVFGLRRAFSPAAPSLLAVSLKSIKGAEALLKGEGRNADTLGVAALDDYRLRIELASPVPYLTALLALPVAFPVPRAAVASHGDNWSAPAHLMGNGPFKLAAAQHKGVLTLVKSPNFRDAASVRVDRVDYYALTDEAALERFRRGEVDAMDNVPLGRLEEVAKQMSDSLRQSRILVSVFVAINMRRAPLSEEVQLRRALALALDRRKLAESFGIGAPDPAFSFVPAGLTNYLPAQMPMAEADQTAREAEARRLLAARDVNRPVRRFVLVAARGDMPGRIAVTLARMWADTLGLDVTVRTMDWKDYSDAIEKGNFDIALTQNVADYADPVTFLESLLSTAGAGNNTGFYSSQAYDGLFRAAEALRDPVPRAVKLRDAEALVLSDSAIIPLIFPKSFSLVSPRLRRWVDNPLSVHLSRWVQISERS